MFPRTASKHVGHVFFRNQLLKSQLVQVYGFAGMTKDLIPGKGKVTRLEVPSQGLLVTIERTEHRSDVGQRLWLCQHSYYHIEREVLPR